MLSYLKKILRKVKLYLIGLKYRYIVKLIAMSYFDNKLLTVQGKISGLDRATLDDPDFIRNEHALFVIDNIDINPVPIIQHEQLRVRERPNHNYDYNVLNNGYVEEYIFSYPIINGTISLREIIKDIKVINPDFRATVTFSVVGNHLYFTYDNWLRYNQNTINQTAQIIFDNLQAQVNGVVGNINDFQNFEINITNYMTDRYGELNMLGL